MATVRHLGLVPGRGCLQTSPSNGLRMPLTDVIAVYWRVRKWSVQVQANWSLGGNSLSHTLLEENLSPFTSIYEEYDDGMLDFSDTASNFVQSEKNLICRGEDGYDSVGIHPNTPVIDMRGWEFRYFGIGRPATSDRFQSFFFASGGNYFYDSILNLYSPDIVFRGGTFRWTVINALDVGATNSTYGSYGAFNLTLLGNTYVCPIFAQNSIGQTDLSVIVDFSAQEYWPYDPEDGLGPIYDSATGAQLRDFPAH
jgi:hypothetical protein